MQIPPQADDKEQQILADIQLRSGLSYRRIGGIDTRDKATAETVLPILAEWVPMMPPRGLRHEIYNRFITVHANRYMRSLVEWAKHEPYSLAVDSLIQAVACAAKPADAEWVWKATHELPKSPFHYFLLAKLARFPAVASEVKDELVEALGSPGLHLYEIQSIGEVDDPRIWKWFESRVDTPDRRVRALARKVVEKGRQLPRGIVYAPAPPDRRGELFSTEVDIHQTTGVLKTLAKDLRLKIPAPVRSADFLSRLEPDHWAVARVQTEQGEPASVWFRLEDFDTVEIVVASR